MDAGATEPRRFSTNAAAAASHLLLLARGCRRSSAARDSPCAPRESHTAPEVQIQLEHFPANRIRFTSRKCDTTKIESCFPAGTLPRCFQPAGALGGSAKGFRKAEIIVGKRLPGELAFDAEVTRFSSLAHDEHLPGRF